MQQCCGLTEDVARNGRAYHRQRITTGRHVFLVQRVQLLVTHVRDLVQRDELVVADGELLERDGFFALHEDLAHDAARQRILDGFPRRLRDHIREREPLREK